MTDERWIVEEALSMMNEEGVEAVGTKAIGLIPRSAVYEDVELAKKVIEIMSQNARGGDAS